MIREKNKPTLLPYYPLNYQQNYNTIKPYKTTNQLLMFNLPRGAKSIMAHPGVPGQSDGMRAASAVHESDPSGSGKCETMGNP